MLLFLKLLVNQGKSIKLAEMLLVLAGGGAGWARVLYSLQRFLRIRYPKQTIFLPSGHLLDPSSIC